MSLLGVSFLVVVVVVVLLVNAALVNESRGIHYSQERPQQRWQGLKIKTAHSEGASVQQSGIERGRGNGGGG